MVSTGTSYLFDHDYAPQPSEKGQGLMHAACTCGWFNRAQLKHDKNARLLWDAHIADLRAQQPPSQE